MHRSLTLAFFSIFATSVALADEIKPEAKARLEHGVELYEKQDYAAAIAEFSAGYALDPKPEFLYARAQAERQAGDCPAAIGDYEKFLESAPPPEREAAARANLARCKDEVAAETPPATPPASPPPSAAPPPVTTAPPAPTPPAPEPAPFYTDVLGDALAGAGVVALGLGAYFYISSKSLENKSEREAEAPSGSTYRQHDDRIDRAESQRTASAVLGGVGIALVAGGVLRFVLHSRAPETPNAARVSPWAERRGAGVSYGGSF